MANKYVQIANGQSNVHFSNALVGETDSSRMIASPIHLTTFNAGDIVPIYCREILPDETLSFGLDQFVIRQTTLLTPTMGEMQVDFYAFFVPNRIVNTSFKAVQGENYSGSWTANQVSLAPLKNSSSGTTQIPVGSVADYYGFPTQQPIPNSVLNLCHDLKFRGYVMIYNEFFRDQNYQPPIAISYLNIYQGFLDTVLSNVVIGGPSNTINTTVVGDGSYGIGSVVHSIYGSGRSSGSGSVSTVPSAQSVGRFRAISPPLKANKLHDYFTSVLPSPQKSQSVLIPASGSLSSVPVITGSTNFTTYNEDLPPFRAVHSGPASGSRYSLGISGVSSSNEGPISGVIETNVAQAPYVQPSNLHTAPGSTVEGIEVSLEDIRIAAAMQQVYEVLARGGSRYRELTRSFFGIDADDPYSDIPVCLGKLTRSLDLYQTAQTAASQEGSTPQGNLAAFGYTSSSGTLFTDHKFLEHGYLHVFAVVRHRNLYSSFMARDNFRLNMFDFYFPQLANISEQPVYTREINPFSSTPNSAFGYQEAWAEYRYEPDQVTGLMRNGVTGSLSLWNYSDPFDSGLQIANDTFIKSNSQAVLDRTLAVTSSVAPQFKGEFKFFVDKTLPMPTYSVPGMDII